MWRSRLGSSRCLLVPNSPGSSLQLRENPRRREQVGYLGCTTPQPPQHCLMKAVDGCKHFHVHSPLPCVVSLLCAHRSLLLKIKMLLTLHFWLLFPLGLLKTLVKDLSSRSCRLDYILEEDNNRVISSPKSPENPHIGPVFPPAELRLPLSYAPWYMWLYYPS